MRTERLDAGVVRTEAPNGLVVLTETMPAVRSAAAGFWVRTASAHEPRAQMGVSHLLEHMVFKGTERRSAREIALALESRGGASGSRPQIRRPLLGRQLPGRPPEHVHPSKRFLLCGQV